jgi:hypothetical protein
MEIPPLLDESGNSTEQTYTAWPDRIYLIDATGHVAYKSKPGPFGFKPEELKNALATVLKTEMNGAAASRWHWKQEPALPLRATSSAYDYAYPRQC